MSAASNKELVSKFLGSAGVEWLQFFHPQFSAFIAGDMEGCGELDLDGLQKLYARLAQDAAGPFIITPLHMISEGNLVAVEAEGHLPLKNGRIYQNHYHIVIAIEDGKIRRLREYSDTDHLRHSFDLKGSAVGAPEQRTHPLRRL